MVYTPRVGFSDFMPAPRLHVFDEGFHVSALRVPIRELRLVNNEFEVPNIAVFT
jgi:hypothetical protein